MENHMGFFPAMLTPEAIRLNQPVTEYTRECVTHSVSLQISVIKKICKHTWYVHVHVHVHVYVYVYVYVYMYISR